MLTLSDEYNTLFKRFQPYYSKRAWKLAVTLSAGTILAPGKRTGTAALRIMGLGQERQFQNYHRVLSRMVWSNLALSAGLLQMLIVTFLPVGPVSIGFDEITESRRGAKIKAEGIYEVRAHLGIETQRQWSDLAIARATPILLGLFSCAILLAHRSQTNVKLRIRQAAWYAKSISTFSDAMALVRSRI